MRFRMSATRDTASRHKRRPALAVAAALAGLCGTLLSGAPASATYWSGGMPTASFSIRPYSYNSQWQPNLDRALTNWFNTPTPANIYKSSSSSSWLEAAQFSDTWYGLYTSWGARNSSRYYRVRLNARTISNDASNFGNFVTSCFVHELGHGLSLADNPNTSSASIMKYTRNRNTMTTPQQYDINDVNAIY
jgi:hypothetical protein